jgi:hypothetical protein
MMPPESVSGFEYLEKKSIKIDLINSQIALNAR